MGMRARRPEIDLDQAHPGKRMKPNMIPYVTTTGDRYAFEDRGKIEFEQSLTRYTLLQLPPNEGSPWTLGGTKPATFYIDEKSMPLCPSDSYFIFDFLLAKTTTNGGWSAVWIPGGIAGIVKSVHFRANSEPIKVTSDHQPMIAYWKWVVTARRQNAMYDASYGRAFFAEPTTVNISETGFPSGYGYATQDKFDLYIIALSGDATPEATVRAKGLVGPHAQELSIALSLYKNILVHEADVSGDYFDERRLHIPLSQLVELFDYTDKVTYGTSFYMMFEFVALATLYQHIAANTNYHPANPITSATVSNLEWHMPAVTLNDIARKAFYASIGAPYTLPYKHWQAFWFDVAASAPSFKKNVTMPSKRPTNVFVVQVPAAAFTALTTSYQTTFNNATSIEVSVNGDGVNSRPNLIQYIAGKPGRPDCVNMYLDAMAFEGKDLTRDQALDFLTYGSTCAVGHWPLTRVDKNKFDPNQSNNTIVLNIEYGSSGATAACKVFVIAAFNAALQIDFKNDTMYFKEHPIKP